jgi:guanylate kinase
MKKNNAKIFIISGPSGVGEDAVIDGLKKKINFHTVITTVTRKKRPGESQGHPYYFISEKKFQAMLERKEFIEWAVVYGVYRGCTIKEIRRLLELEKPIIWKVDWQGVKTIKKFCPEAVAIFITVPSYQILVKRLIKRGLDSAAVIKNREKFTKNWLKHKGTYDYTVINQEGKLKQTIDKIEKIINKELNG